MEAQCQKTQKTNEDKEWYAFTMMIRNILLCVLFILPSCASPAKNDGSVITRPFSAVDQDRVIVLSPSHAFEIVLPSNPTTGYSWALHISNSDVVKNVSQKYVPHASGRVGVGGNTTWTLRTAKVGETELEFSYLRQWEKDAEPTRVVNFTIHVR